MKRIPLPLAVILALWCLTLMIFGERVPTWAHVVTGLLIIGLFTPAGIRGIRSAQLARIRVKP